MHSEIVIKQEDRTPKVPRVVGSGCHVTVSLAVMLPNIENTVRDIGALTGWKGFDLKVWNGISMILRRRGRRR